MIHQPIRADANYRSRGDSPRPLLSVRQAAELLGVSRASVYKLVERGELPCVRISNAIRVRLLDLERWLAEQVQDVNEVRLDESGNPLVTLCMQEEE